MSGEWFSGYEESFESWQYKRFNNAEYELFMQPYFIVKYLKNVIKKQTNPERRFYPNTEDHIQGYFIKNYKNFDHSKIKYTSDTDLDTVSKIIANYGRSGSTFIRSTVDLGYIDNTGMVFGYWDFLNNKLIIEDDAAFNKPTSSKIAEVVKEKEKSLWQINNTIKEPYRRIIDGNDITIADLNAPPNNLRFVKTRNDDPQAAVNEVRVMLYNKQIIIHPRCVNLISEMKSAIWDNTGRRLARSDEQNRGHFDILMALVYLVRNLNKKKNPYPPGGYFLDPETHYIHPDKFIHKNSNAEVLKKALLSDFNKRFKGENN